MVMVLMAGMGMMQGMAASNTIIQTLVSEDKRGRVMSYYTMAFMGMAPFGSLLAGTMAQRLRRADGRSSSTDRWCCWARHGSLPACPRYAKWFAPSIRRWASFPRRERWQRSKFSHEQRPDVRATAGLGALAARRIRIDGRSRGSCGVHILPAFLARELAVALSSSICNSAHARRRGAGLRFRWICRNGCRRATASGWWIPAEPGATFSRFTVLYLHGQDGNLGDTVIKTSSRKSSQMD